MENQRGAWQLGDLKCLKDDETFPHKCVESIVVAGKSEDCFKMEQIIKRLNPTKKIIPVTSADELLGLLNFYIPDLLIMDMQMPCKKGVQCLKQLREDRNYDELPIVAYSASHRPSNNKVALELGASLYFEKPEDEDHLWNILINLISKDWQKKSEGLRTA
jgi:CheY-like chemotaxis protein